MLLLIGLILNLHKWILFLVRVQTSIKAEIVLAEMKTTLQQDQTYDHELMISKKPSVEMLPLFKSE